MRIAALLLLGAVAWAAPSAEETAALLLSPRAQQRADGQARFEAGDKAFRREVLAHVVAWGHDPEAWLQELVAATKDANGSRRAHLQTLIEHLSPAPKTIHDVDIVCAEVPRALADRIGKAPTGVHGDDRHLADALRMLRENRDARTLLARRTACNDRWPVSVAAVRRVSYVRAVEVSNGRADPVVATIEPGVAVDVRPAVSRDRARVTVTVRVRVSDLARPIAVVEKRIEGHALTARIQTPHVEETVVHRTVTMPLGGHCVLRLAPGAGIVKGKDRAIVVLLRAAPGSKPIPLPEEKPRG